MYSVMYWQNTFDLLYLTNAIIWLVLDKVAMRWGGQQLKTCHIKTELRVSNLKTFGTLQCGWREIILYQFFEEP